MKEPNIGTPDEDEIRAHFKGLLHPEKEIEIIPHTRIWATKEGVLLWDPKNGFADPFNPMRVAPVPEEPKIAQAKTKTIMYLTGPTESGKTTLVKLMGNAIELERKSFIGFVDLTRAVAKHDNVETVVISNNSTAPAAFNIDQALRIYCRERKLKYFSINLTRDQNGN